MELDESYRQIMEAVHIDEWDFLECPLCNNELYICNYQRIETPMVNLDEYNE